MPELEFLELWTVNSAAAVVTNEKRIRQLGINFGAPGDRRDADGMLWLEYPIVAGTSPPLPIELESDTRFFRHHSASMMGNEFPWVLASGIVGASEIRVGLSLEGTDQLSKGLAVSHPDDDAEEDESGNVNLSSSDLELVEEAETQLVGIRFNKINLPRNAAIRRAFLQFTCDERSSAPTSLILNAEMAGHSKRFSNDSHELSRRARTRAEVAWES